MGLTDVYVNVFSPSSSYGGGLVGFSSGTIMNSYATGDVEVDSSSSSSYGGGLVGENDGSITNSYATGDVEVDSSSPSYSGGLVGISHGTIMNSYATGDVEVDSSSTSSTFSYGGGLVGISYGTISNSYATGNVEVEADSSSSYSYSYGGGLVGISHGTISNSYATGNVEVEADSSSTSSTFSYGGGLVGISYGTISNNYATGNVEVEADSSSSYSYSYGGGLVGISHGTISNSYATGDVEADSSTSSTFSYGGGLVGISYGTISNSYATGNVEVEADSSSSNSYSYGGGLVGYNNSGGSITNSYATGSVGCGGTCPVPIFGGLVGENFFGTISGTNYFVDDQGGADGVGLGTTCAMGAVCQRRTFVELGALTSVTGWEASDWDFDTAIQLPRLKYTEVAAHCTDSSRTSKSDCEAINTDTNAPYGVWLAEGAECEAITLNTAANDGDANIPDCGDVIPGQVSPKGSPVNPHIITTYAELKTMRNDLTAHYKLGGNIDASASWEEGEVNCDEYEGDGELPTGTPCTGWVPVGDNSTDDNTTRFTGSLDGAGYAISNLYVRVNAGSVFYVGLFGYAGGRSEIRNVGLKDVYINVTGPSGGLNSGALAGRSAGTIVNSYATGKATVSSASESYCGGLVGYQISGTIINSYAMVDVAGSHSTAGNLSSGGLVGVSNGAITNSYATGDVEATSTASNTDPNGGGLVGLAYGTIVNSYATGDVTVSSAANQSVHGGGLVGGSQSGTTIQNSYARGDVTVSSPSGDSYGGGLVGYSRIAVTNSYATGSVSCGGTCNRFIPGGLAGWLDGGTVTGTNYFVANHGGTNGLGGGTCTGTCERRTLAQLAALTSVIGWAASDWHFGTTTHLPRLKYAELAAYCTDSSKTTQAACEAANSANNNNPFGVWLAGGAECEAITPPASNTSANDGNPNTPDCGDVLPDELFSGGSGTRVDPYIITNYSQLNYMGLNLTAHYKLGNAIDARASWNRGAGGCTAYTGNGELPSGNPCTGWVPVGDNSDDTDATRFTGSLDGAGYTIMSLYVYVRAGAGGLFGYTGNGSEIKNVGLTDVYVNVSSSNSDADGGGLVGYNRDGSISNSYATGKVIVTGSGSGIFITIISSGGGLVGYNRDGSISNSYAAVEVEAYSTATGTNALNPNGASSYASGGGLVGSNGGIIMNSYATGFVIADSTAGGISKSSSFSYGGGLVGVNTEPIINSYATGNVEISSAASTTSATYSASSEPSGGGLVGQNAGIGGGTISNSYATGNVGCKAGGTCTNPKFAGLVGSNKFTSGTTTYTGTITGTNYFVYNGAGTADDDGVHTGSCTLTICKQATGATAALRLTWMRDTLDETTAFTTQAGTSPAYTAWDTEAWADLNKSGGFPRLKYAGGPYCSNSSYTTQTTCEANGATWTVVCEVITPSSDNTAANNGDATIPDCGDLIPGQ